MIHQGAIRLTWCTVAALVLSLELAYPLAAAPPSRALAPAPQNCPTTPAPSHLFENELGGFAGFGASPVWAGIAYLHPVMHLSSRNQMAHGWGFKVLWLLDPTATSPVTLRGWNLRTGKHIWFITTNRAASTHPVLDPKMPPAGSAVTPAGWGSFPSNVIVPSAGCYVLFAQWKEGSWILPFAAGA